MNKYGEVTDYSLLIGAPIPHLALHHRFLMTYQVKVAVSRLRNQLIGSSWNQKS